MQGRINGPAVLATLETARPPGWQAAAVGEYERSWPVRQADLRKALSARIPKLTGRYVFSEEIYTDGHLAVAGVDDINFRLYQAEVLKC